MPVYRWRRQPTKYFGDTWVPFVELHLRRNDGGFETLSIQADTGAVISLLRRSVADLLGLDYESGRSVELGAVGGNPVHARVHEVEFRMGDSLPINAPFAIAANENVPNLLGRLAFMDRFQFHFDPTLEETRVSAPWMQPRQVEFYRHLIRVDGYISARWQTHPLPQPVDRALGALTRRGQQVLAAVCGLLRVHLGFEMLSLMRGLFEISLQVEYLLCDEQERVPRAQAYVDFEHVTRWKDVYAILQHPEGAIATNIANDPGRSAGEAKAKREYERVKPAFLRDNKKGNGSRVWDKWYKMSVSDLAEKVDRSAEYRVWYRWGSGWLHGDPFASQNNPAPPDGAAITAMAWHGRILQTVADAKSIVLESSDYDLLRTCARGVI